MLARYVRDDRTRRQALDHDLRFHGIIPTPPAHAREYFNPRRFRSSHVVRMVVHSEHPSSKGLYTTGSNSGTPIKRVAPLRLRSSTLDVAQDGCVLTLAASDG